jgi:hypothetical protein
MSTPARRVVVLGGAALALGWRQVALGAEGEAVRIEFVAPPGCPDSGSFAHRIEERIANLRRAVDGERARVVRGEIEARAGGVLGRLVLIETDGRTSERTLEAADCRQATDALALIAALAIDPRARETASAASSAPAHPGPPPAPSQVERPAPPPVPPAPPPRPVPSPAPSAPSASPAKAEGETRRPHPLSFQATATAFGTLGMAPGPTAGGALLVGVLVEGPRAPWSWSVRIGVADTADRSFDRLGGTATFGLLAGLAEVCPLALRFGERIWVRPCVGGEYGVVRVGASNTSSAHPVDRPWGGAGLGFRFGVRVAGPFWVDAAIGGLVALQRDGFEFGDARFFDSPPVVGRALVGVGAIWP